MKFFVISLNGNIVASAGAPGEKGILTTIITWVGRPSENPGGEGQFSFHIGGVDGITGERLDWSTPVVSPGDEIKIRIIDADVHEVSQNFTRTQFSEEDTQG